MILRMLIVLAVVYLALVAMMYFFQPRLLFLPGVPGRELTTDPGHAGMTYEEVEIATEDGERLHAWWIPHPEPRATLLFQHGNAGNISHRLDSIGIFNDLGLNVLIYDYRGYGRSTGSPSEKGVYADARAAWSWLVDERAESPDRIVLFGRSMGAAVAAHLATEVEAAGLIVESAFSSVPDIGSELYWWLPVRLLSRLEFNTREYVSRADMPVLVIHSPDDEIIPFRHAQAVHEAAGDRGRLLEIRGDHNTGFLASGRIYTDGLDRFVGDIVQ